jgi:hypothetical protein
MSEKENSVNIYLVSQTQNCGYDTYSDFVVCAKNEEEARNANPINGKQIDWSKPQYEWCSGPEHVTADLIGKAAKGIKAGVICASFNAG